MKTNHGTFHQFSPREQNSSRESPSSSHRRVASSTVRPWDGEYQDQDEIYVSISSPRALSKKQQGSPQYAHSRNQKWTSKNTSRGKILVMNDRQRQLPEQLANIKQQWNAQRDIPSGAVRNNPFLPKRDPSPPRSPQLVHQKKQWDTADIPLGSVSSNSFLMDKAEVSLEKRSFPSPRRSQNLQQRSFGSSGREDTEALMHPTSPRFSAPVSPIHHTVMQQTSKIRSGQKWCQSSPQGKFDSMNHLMNHGNELAGQERTECSRMSRSVPVGLSYESKVNTCTGTKLDFERNGTRGGSGSSPLHQQNVYSFNRVSGGFTGWKPSQEIPKGTVKGHVTALFGGANMLNGNLRQAKQIMAADMDEDPWIIPAKIESGASIPIHAKSDDSEEWDNPNTDWLQKPNSNATNTSSKSGFYESGMASVSTREESSSLNRDKEDEFSDTFDQPLNPTNDRGMDMLMATKIKNAGSSPLGDVAEVGPCGGSSSTFRGAEFESHAFPVDKSFEPSFVDFHERDKLNGDYDSFHDDESEDAFYDAGPTQYESPQDFEETRQTEEPDSRSLEVESRKERRSIFNMFGGGRKDKGTKMSKSRLSFGSAHLGRKTTASFNSDRRLESPTRQQKQSLEYMGKGTKRVANELSRANQSTSNGTLDQGSTILPRIELLNVQENDSSLDSKVAEHCHCTEMEAEWPKSLSTGRTQAKIDSSIVLGYYVEKKLYDGSKKLQVNERPIGYSTEHSNAHHTLRENKVERFQYSHKNSSADSRNCDDATPRLQKSIDTNSDSERATLRASSRGVVTEMHKPACAGRDLSPPATAGSGDSDSDRSRELLNKIENDHSRSFRSGADRKRKTEKLRRYGEVNARFKEQSHQIISDSTPSRSYPRTLKNSRYTKEAKDRGSHYEEKTTIGSRHAKIKYNITGSKLAKRNEYEDILSTKTKRSKARNYARQRAGFVVAEDFMLSNSSESIESVTLAAVGSDIRVLRSIVRRPNRPVSAVSSQCSGDFPTFEEATLDPMQQSGLKMLSATIIPMQAQVRRFLAMRRALTRMWALIVIQAHTRRWIAEKRYKNTVQSAITIQAVVRGHLARDDLDFKHVCAIEIQRVMRGYMSTMKVYEDIYKITVIQSYVRMKQVMDKASWRMAHIVQLQSVFRGFLVRRRQEYQQICAIAIQANWRRFYRRLNYQFDLLDIIIIQSVWRKKLATSKLEGIQQARLDNAAAVIQSKWRQILYSSIYNQDMANILVAQSALRRYLARKRARLIRDYWLLPAQAYARGYLARRALVKHRAARKIQSIWRGFVGYADYMFNIADIVTVQKFARGWLARREANQSRKRKMAATTIQSVSRVVLSKATMMRIAAVTEMEMRSMQVSEREERSAAVIQTTVRRMQTQSAFIAFVAARKIQTFWRCRNLTNAYKYYRAAMTIQSIFRGMKARQETLILRGEILAATIIQSAWRGFVSYSDYIFTVSDIITVQRAFRGHLARKTKDGATVHKAIQERRKRIAAATMIQKGCRGLLDRQRYWYALGCTVQIQSWMRGRLVVIQLLREASARVKLQSSARRYLARQQYVQKKFIFMLIQTAEQERSKKIEALIVQEKARNDFDEKRRHNAACTIQRFFVSVRQEVDQIVRASRRRKNWRKKNANKKASNVCGEKGSNDLLEDAWLDVACDSNLENDSFLGQTMGKIGSNQDSKVSKEVFSVEDSRSSVGHVKDENHRSPEENHMAAKKSLLPPSKSVPLSRNSFAKLTGSETAFYRLPQARMRMMGSREMSDDLELEEAFMDTKIFNAKHRRIANKKSSYGV